MDVERFKRVTDKIHSDIDKAYLADFQLSIDILAEKALAMPSLKHFWFGRLMRAKQEEKCISEELERRRDFKRLETSRGLKIDVSPEVLSKMKLETDEKIEELEQQLAEVAYKRELLDKTVGNISYNMTQDVRNMIDMHKLETT